MKKIGIGLLLLGLSSYGSNLNGESLYSKCSGCHGSKGEIPAMGKSNIIAGQKVFDLIDSFKGYLQNKKNEAGMATLMKGQLASFSEAELATLAIYISEMNPSKKQETDNKNHSIITFEHHKNIFTVSYPLYVQKGKNFIIELKLKSHSPKKMGGISISFPNQQEINGYVISKAFDSIHEYTAPKKVFNRIAKRSKKVEYALLEGWENDWQKGSTRYIKLKLHFPKDASKININLRAVLIDSQKKELLIPQQSEHLDQQGYPVEQIQIRSK
jgi:cytochrome c553